MPDSTKPSNVEEEYFAREDVEKKHAMALRRAAALEDEQREQLRKLHHGHCPNCGMELHKLKRGVVETETCFNCQGVWLPKGQLEHLMNEHEGFGSRLVSSVLEIFERWTPTGKKW
jgi:uncharacterized protein